MKPILFLLFLICTLHGADVLNPETSKLPVEAASLVNVYEADVVKIQTEADKAIVAKASALRDKLVKAQANATKKGDLDGALAIKDAIEKLPKEAPKKKEPINIVGSWDYVVETGYRSVLVLSDKGMCSVHDNGGTYKVDEKGKVTLSWKNGKVETLTLADDRLSGTGTTNEGAVTQITRK